MAKPKIDIYDTTLRDGAQAEGFVLTVGDKLKAAERLDRLGVAYIEGGWPGSNPRDKEFFARAAGLKPPLGRLTAFGSTHHPKNRPDNDANLAELAASGARTAAVVGKTWPRHLTAQLGVSPERNLEMISGSVEFLRKKGLEVFFDAEHFFDAYAEDADYALAVLDAAARAGASALVLCDTNGGSLPGVVAQAVGRAVRRFPGVVVGIHVHNDSGLAVASSLAAVEAGARQVQGTMGGFGERCGNADLCAIIPNLELKMGYECLPPGRLELLTHTARFIQELANTPPDRYAPYVGVSAFSHKGGLHISAVDKDPVLYEHVDPALVGNTRRFLVSDMAGRATILNKARACGLDLSDDDESCRRILSQLKERENLGYQYEGAEASFELLMYSALGRQTRFFDLVGFRVMDFKAAEDEPPQAEATIRVRVGDQEEHTAANGEGPVHALDQALRKALTRFFPQLREVRLVDYKVRVLSGADGTAASVRVLIESSDGKSVWGAVGVSFDVLEASWQALGDSIRYKLLKDSQNCA